MSAPKYTLTFYTYSRGKQRILMKRGFDNFNTPMDAMKCMNEYFIEHGGYGSVTQVTCLDSSTKVEQWHFMVC